MRTTRLRSVCGIFSTFSSISASFSSIIARSFCPRSGSPAAAASNVTVSRISARLRAPLQTMTFSPASRSEGTMVRSPQSGTTTRSGCRAMISSTVGLPMRCGMSLTSVVTLELTGSSSKPLTATMRSGSTRPSIVSSVLIESVTMRCGGAGKSTIVPSISVTVYAAGFSSAAFGMLHAVSKTHSIQRRTTGIFFFNNISLPFRHVYANDPDPTDSLYERESFRCKILPFQSCSSI